MPTRAKDEHKTGRTRATSRKPPAPKPRARKTPKNETAPASEKFVRELLVRGEAAKPDKAGKLPPEATHAITKENPDGTVEVKRARFKLF